MSISGFLENFSLPELLRLIDLGSKSGRLILQIRSAPERPDLVGLYHVWFQEGQLVLSQKSSEFEQVSRPYLKPLRHSQLVNLEMVAYR